MATTPKGARRSFLKSTGAATFGLVASWREAALEGKSTSADGRHPSYDVRDFGARGDGRTIDSPAINTAINAAAETGGGTVHFSPGNYLCYSIRLRSNVASADTRIAETKYKEL